MPFYRFGDPGADTWIHLKLGRKARGPGNGNCQAPKFPKDNPAIGESCARISVALCDAPGCDIPICELHRTKHPSKPDTDYCPDHKGLAV